MCTLLHENAHYDFIVNHRRVCTQEVIWEKRERGGRQEDSVTSDLTCDVTPSDAVEMNCIWEVLSLIFHKLCGGKQTQRFQIKCHYSLSLQLLLSECGGRHSKT